MMGMPFNTTEVQDLYCVGDSTFPGQGVNAVVFSGFGCAHRCGCLFAVLFCCAAFYLTVRRLIQCLATPLCSTCAHHLSSLMTFLCPCRILCDVGKQPTIPVLDGAFQTLLRTIHNAA